MSETIDAKTGEVLERTNSNGGKVVNLARMPPAEGGGLDLLSLIEKRAKLLERILDYAIAATHPEQWFDFSGTPWPSGPACESMARRCGVSITNVRSTKRLSTDDKGDFYIYVCEATVSLPSGFDSIEAMGTCSSRDTFLGTETSAGRPMSEIDEGSIMKAAYTNCEVNGITRLLGVRRLSWDRLKALGLDKSAMGSVSFNAGAKGGGQQASGADIELKFGKSKGKRLGDIEDADLAWYLAAFERDLADPAKAKYKANAEKQLAAAKAVQAARAGAKAEAPKPKFVTFGEKQGWKDKPISSFTSQQLDAILTEGRAQVVANPKEKWVAGVNACIADIEADLLSRVAPK